MLNTPSTLPSKEDVIGHIPDNDEPFYGDDDAPFYAPDGGKAGTGTDSPDKE